MNLVLDCDPGLDDAVAILVAARYADLIGITTVAGNVGINRTTRNALVVAQLAGLDVPVHRGAGKSLAGEPVDGSRIHGETGLGNAVLPDLDRSEASADAVAYLCDTARSVDDLHLLAIGPLTNVALALQCDPDLRRHLAGLTIMGGSASAGNITSVAEFNIWADPEAAAIVFEKAAPVTMVGLDVTNKVVFGAEETARMRAAGRPAADLAADVTDFLRDRFRQYVGRSVVPLHDATAVIAATHPHLFERSRHPVTVEVDGEITRGMTVADLRPPALIEAIGPAQVAASDIVWDTDVDAVRELIVEAVLAF
ncbi:MAG: nucleoside hydrolase [Acidobacteria bacterium]|nr:nucleoside hydrolase [Acidobacteriota bacterium]